MPCTSSSHSDPKLLHQDPTPRKMKPSTKQRQFSRPRKSNVHRYVGSRNTLGGSRNGLLPKIRSSLNWVHYSHIKKSVPGEQPSRKRAVSICGRKAHSLGASLRPSVTTDSSLQSTFMSKSTSSKPRSHNPKASILDPSYASKVTKNKTRNPRKQTSRLALWSWKTRSVGKPNDTPPPEAALVYTSKRTSTRKQMRWDHHYGGAQRMDTVMHQDFLRA